MLRSIYRLTVLVLVLPVFSLGADDNGSAAIVSYFTGKQVTVKIDMPGTQKGVDLRFNKAAPMDWKEYSSRLKQSGPAIHKGDISRVTTVVVKKDMIEFQLDGGSYGTFGDDTSTTVAQGRRKERLRETAGKANFRDRRFRQESETSARPGSRTGSPRAPECCQ